MSVLMRLKKLQYVLSGKHILVVNAVNPHAFERNTMYLFTQINIIYNPCKWREVCPPQYHSKTLWLSPRGVWASEAQTRFTPTLISMPASVSPSRIRLSAFCPSCSQPVISLVCPSLTFANMVSVCGVFTEPAVFMPALTSPGNIHSRLLRLFHFVLYIYLSTYFIGRDHTLPSGFSLCSQSNV